MAGDQEMPEYLKSALRNGTPPEIVEIIWKRHAEQRKHFQATERLHGPHGPVTADEIEVLLRQYPRVEQFLGNHYRQLAAAGALTEDLTPLCWDDTESNLESILAEVQGLAEHWTGNTVGGSESNVKSRLYADLAEIEGFSHLLKDKQFDLVQALPIERGRVGRTPEACCWAGDTPYLFEVKSLWAYLESRRHQLKPLGQETYRSTAVPRGASVAAANRLKIKEEGRELDDAEYNALVVHLTITRLLRDAGKQLQSYARRKNYADCSKIVLLVATRRTPIVPVLTTGRDVARTWLSRNRSGVTNVEMFPGVLSGTPWESLGAEEVVARETGDSDA